MMRKTTNYTRQKKAIDIMFQIQEKLIEAPVETGAVTKTNCL